MIAVDTNIIIRFLVCDDKKQAAIVRKRFIKAERNRERLHIPLLVVLEMIWVLESAYDKSRAEILTAIRDIRQMPIFEFEADDAVERFIHDGETYKADLADILIANSSRAAGCEEGITFDRMAARIPFFSLLH